MNENYHRFHQIIYLSFELTCIAIGFVLAIYLRFDGEMNRIYSESLSKFLFIFVITWFLSGLLTGIYETNRLIKIGTRINKLIQALFIHILLLSTVFLLFNKSISREMIFYTFILSFTPIFIFRMVFLAFIRWLRIRGLNVKKFVIIGDSQLSKDVLTQMLKYPEYGFKLKGVFSDNGTYIENTNEDVIKGSFNEALDYINNNKIDEVYCTSALSEKNKIQSIIRCCEEKFIRFKYIPDLEGVYGHKVNINFFESLPIITIRKEPLQVLTNQIIKRFFDICFSLFVLLVIFPFLLLAVAPAILLESRGPLFYRQNRAGLNGTNFKIWKFRTMNVTESDGEFKQATIGDSRITKIGKILRKTNLDEMPQFLNVLIGNMSIVGPRPHVEQLNSKFRNIVNEYNIRLLIKPGLTGHAQINGFRGETRTNEQMQGRIELDVWYLENWSFLLDIKIIFRTIFNMAKGEENAG
jgi:undecaprenyl-phosphate galactose phosphotransferase/putative colanic acid biosynthesis UDP-glucose lipid carrier transferase